MSVHEIVKRLREGLDLSEQAAQEALKALVLTVRVDDLYSAGDAPPRYAAWGYNFSNALAGNYSILQPYNPADSGILCHLERVIFLVSATSTVYGREGDTALGSATGNEQWRDRRQTHTPALEVRTHQAAAVGGSVLLAFPTRGYAADVVELDADLKPGQGYTFAPSVQNQNVIATFWWTERPVRPADRT